MNPNAKEFIPAKKRQEEAERPTEDKNNQPTEQQTKINDKDDCNGETKANNSGHEDEDQYLLRAGENICEFNGEQFIIPGDEYEEEKEYQDHQQRPGYDFGNAEDNEDEDICQAFDDFLDNLPE